MYTTSSATVFAISSPWLAIANIFPPLVDTSLTLETILSFNASCVNKVITAVPLSINAIGPCLSSPPA